MTDPALMSSEMTVLPEWIDYNGHLNMAFYSVLFDRGAEEAYELLGFGADYAENSGFTTYSGEFHIRYLRELHVGDRVRVRFVLLDHDDKKFRTWQELYHADGWMAATGETLALHIDRSGPRVAPFPPDILARMEKMKADHAPLGVPDRAGSGIALGHKSVAAK